MAMRWRCKGEEEEEHWEEDGGDVAGGHRREDNDFSSRKMGSFFPLIFI